MLEAAVLRSERPHARILRLDVGRAAALPGVQAVAWGEDLPGRYGELYKNQEPSWPHQFCSDCIIATRGYDFREGQV